MATPNVTYRFNPDGMQRCCRLALESELYNRREAKQEIMPEGEVIKCLECNSEMICDPSTKDGRLRWRLKD